MSEKSDFLYVNFDQLEIDTEQNYRTREGYDDDGIKSLADSMAREYEKSGGSRWLLQPIRIRPIADAAPGGPAYTVHVGFRRSCAIEELLYGDGPTLDEEGNRLPPTQNLWAQMVPAFVDADPEASVATQLIENLQRQDPSPLETAQALQMMQGKGKNKLTNSALGQSLGRSASWVQQHLGLLKLCEDARDALSEGTITFAHGRALLRLKSMVDQRDMLAACIKKEWDASRLDSAITKLIAARDAEKIANAVAEDGDEEIEPASAGEVADAMDDGYVSDSTIDDAEDTRSASSDDNGASDTSSGETPVGQVTQTVIPSDTLYVKRKVAGAFVKAAKSDVRSWRKLHSKEVDAEAREKLAMAVGFHSAIQAVLEHFVANNDLAGFVADDAFEALPSL